MSTPKSIGTKDAPGRSRPASVLRLPAGAAGAPAGRPPDLPPVAEGGARVLGIGYATPFLGPLLDDAERVCVIMPSGQGVAPWPAGGANVTALASEDELPLADRSIDRVLMVHAWSRPSRAAPAARGVAGPGGWRPGPDHRAQPARPVVPEREHAVRLRTAVQRRPAQGRCATRCSCPRKRDGAVRAAAALASGPAHRARLGTGGPPGPSTSPACC